LITKAKENTTHQRRLVFSRLQDKVAVKELFDVISPKVANRPGGYTRVIKLGKRVGDNSELALIELVDYNEVYEKGIAEKETATGKKTRRAGRSKKAAEAKPAAGAKVPEVRPEQLPVPESQIEEAKNEIAPEEKPEQPDSDKNA
jgi:large subunit ribosomal protein L17